MCATVGSSVNGFYACKYFLRVCFYDLVCLCKGVETTVGVRAQCD